MTEPIDTAAAIADLCREPTPQECAAQVLRFLPAYERAIGASEEDREASLADLISDTLHLARQLGFDPAAVAATGLRAFHEEDKAPGPCSACGEPTGEGINCPNGNFVCRACFDAGSDGPEPEPTLRVFYVCPDCGNEWHEEYDCACDSECDCGARNVAPVSWEEI